MLTKKEAINHPCELLNVDKHFLNACQQHKNVSIVRASIKNNILVIDIFSTPLYQQQIMEYFFYKEIKPENLKYFGERLPSYRLFIDKKANKYITVNMFTNKISEASLLHLRSFYLGYNIEYLGESASVILSVFCVEDKTAEALTVVNDWQQTILKSLKQAQFQIIKDQTDVVMQKIKNPPPDLNDFILNESMKQYRYAFFARFGRKRIAKCSHCDSSFELEKCFVSAEGEAGFYIPNLKPRNIVKCPECKSELIVLTAKKMRAHWSQQGQTIIIQSLKDGSGFVLRHFETIRRCDYDVVLPLESVEFCRQVYNTGHKKPQYYYYGYFKDTSEIRWCHANDIYNCYYGWSGAKFRYSSVYYRSSFYIKNIKKEIKNTDIQYIEFRKFYQIASIKDYNIDNYITECLKKPFIESLIKVGAKKLALHYAKANGNDFCHASSLKDILGICSCDMKLIISKNLDAGYLPYFRVLKNTYHTLEQVNYLKSNDFDDDFLSKLLQVASLKKIINYLSKNSTFLNFKRDWHDTYINMEKLNISHKNDNLLFAKDFKSVHDNLYKQVIAIQNYENNAAFTQICESKKDFFEYVDPERALCVLMPKSINELVYEGEILDHCVGTYSDRVISGKSYILFIRKTDKADIPFYTAQISSELNLIQCRTHGNKDMNAEIKNFVNQWLSELKEKVKQKKTA